jgi:cell division protein FtsW (lipid II flippase)
MKIVFILFMASALCDTIRSKDVVLTGFFALAHVGILVLSRDLGSAMIFYVIFIMMLFLATGRWRYVFGGLLAGAAGSVVCYFLFSHVRVRVDVFMNPWNSNYIDNMSYQITQSLFAISYGGPWGAGLGRGMPERIPFVVSDFIFSAVAEELGLIFACCMIALCINCFLDALLLSETYSNRFFRLYTFGAGVCYLFQTFVTVGGEVKFIPLTGVTLPFVSYGGSSVLSSLIMFAMIGAIFILHSEREDMFRHRYESERAAYEKVPARQDEDPDDGFYRGFKPADDISRYDKDPDGTNRGQYYR